MTRHEKLMQSPTYRRLYYVHGAGIDAAELVARLLGEQARSPEWLGSELSKRCNVQTSESMRIVRRLFSDGEISLWDLAAMLYELGYELKLSARKIPVTNEF